MNTIVYTVDNCERALAWLDVSLASARRFLGDGVRIVVCTDSPRDFGHGTECVDVRPYMERYRIGRISALKWGGAPVRPMQVFRLALPLVDELAEESRVVFVDADTEFASGRWAEVFSAECDLAAGVRDGGQSLAFVRRRHQAFLSSSAVIAAVGEERIREIGDGSYVNGGVLVMNLDGIRRKWTDYAALLDRMLDLCVSERLKYLDQDLISLFFRPQLLPSRYNSSPHLHSPGEPTWLEHYSGQEKSNGKVYPPLRFQLARERARGGDVRVPIVYVVGEPSSHDDQELRWSLRSVEKFGRNAGRVIVVSPCRRDWLSDEVEQVVVADPPNAGHKHHVILNAILKAVDLADICVEFSVSSDDHFWVKPVDFARQPLVAQHWAIPARYKSSPYLQTMLWASSMVDTRDFLFQHGLPTIDFQMHRNARWHAAIVREHRDLFEEAKRWRFCVEPHVLAQNLWVHAHPDEEVVFRPDCKIKAFFGVEDWCDCISIYDEAFSDRAFMDFMEREFGGKCRYER